MSQSRKRDIADFFRANARETPLQSPRKRRTPNREDSIASSTKQDRTPSTVRQINRQASQPGFGTPRKALTISTVTPTSGRSLSLAYRSPGGVTVRKDTTSLFSTEIKTPASPPDQKSSFVFADAPNSSRKVIEDGKLVAVRDSDESDNESLASLTDIFERKEPNVSSSSAEQPSSSAGQEAERVRLLNMYTGGRSNPIVNRDRMRALQRKEREPKLDVGLVIDEDQREEAARSRIAQIEAELEQSTRDIQESQQKHLDSKLLASILKGDVQDTKPEELARLMNAVDRTEALAGEKAFCFFGHMGPRNLTQEKRSKKAYPIKAIPNNLWQPKDIVARNRMYLSGFMADLARRGKLSDEALRWTYDSVLHEPESDLRHAYLNCCAAASSTWTRANVTPEDVQHMFVSLGAEESATLDSTTIETQRQHIAINQRIDHLSLLDSLSMLDTLCQDMDFPTLSKLASLITRLCLDSKIMLHNQTMQAVESLLQKLADLPESLSRQHVHDRILSDLVQNMTEPVLQAQFISHFSPASTAGAKFRIKLATTFLLGSKRAAKLLKPHSTKPVLATLLNHVNTSPTFQINPGTNFPDLAAAVFLLDITISSGYAKNLHTSVDENAFNAQVDNLADKIHDLFTNISDAGASHLHKTEAKGALQALYNRLLFAVRTKVRRKKAVFASSDTSMDRWATRDEGDTKPVGGQNFMSRFLKQQERRSEETEEFVDVPEL